MKEALGNLFDIGIGCVPTDAVAGAITGKRIGLRDGDHLTYVICATGASTDTLNPTIQEHTAKSGGTSTNLARIDHYFTKSAATLANTETWTKTTQTASASITALGTASQQLLAVIEVNADMLDDGYSYVSLNLAQGSNATHFTTVLYFLTDLKAKRKPANMLAPLR